MPIENYRMVFELDEEAFSGYFSNEELADLSEDDIATVITERDITKMCDQLDLPWDLIWIISGTLYPAFRSFNLSSDKADH